ncbi:MAG: carboxylesterase family protein [Clostridia bacterium]|nr:carboxylesterase family protein [Clostridia bacterium]
MTKKTVAIAQGMLEAVEREDYYLFKGIPYAEAGRFQPPAAPGPWQGIFRADRFAPKCPQSTSEPGSRKKSYNREFFNYPEFAAEQGEDCLRLNIWTPKQAKDCPVALWIHGGSYMSGYGSECEFDGAEYVRRGIILVTFNYRLGVLGFFTHPGLDERDGNSGNYGMMDQIAAFNWVYENIAAFGGDPNRITVFGQSAGSIGVNTLILQPELRGKIQGAIMQSSGAYRSPLLFKLYKQDLQKAYVSLLKERRISLRDMETMPAMEVNRLNIPLIVHACLRTHTIFNFGPTIGCWKHDTDSDTAFEQGREHAIPYIIGCTKNDIAIGFGGSKSLNRNRMHQCSLAFAQLEAGRGNPVYTYYFRRDLPGDSWGAFHASELWYMFGTLDRCWRDFTPQDYELSRRMLDAWAAFMHTGDPGWPCCTAENGCYTEIFDIKETR